MHRPLPSNPDAEREVIGALLFQSSRIADDVLPLLKHEDFHSIPLSKIWAACLELHQARQPIDMITVAERMRTNGTLPHLAASGGEAHLVDLANAVGASDTANVVQHAQIVLDCSRRKSCMQIADKMAEQASSGAIPCAEITERAQAALQALADRTLRAEVPKPLKRLLHEAVGTIEARYSSQRAVTGIPWGLTELDALTHGRQPGHLIIVAGRPASGKTALVLGSAIHAAKEGTPGLLFSIEMSDAELAERTIASEARVDGRALRTGFLDSSDWIKITKSIAQLADAPLQIDDEAGPDLMTITAKCRRWRRDRKIFPQGNEPGFVIVDYLQLIATSGRQQNREREVAELSKGLKALAKELRVPIIAVASLSRDCEKRTDKRPQLSDLRDSGNIESDADEVLFVYRDEMYNQNSPDRGTAEILLAKHRSGPTGMLRVNYLAASTTFTDLGEPNGR